MLGNHPKLVLQSTYLKKYLIICPKLAFFGVLIVKGLQLKNIKNESGEKNLSLTDSIDSVNTELSEQKTNMLRFDCPEKQINIVKLFILI